MLIFAVMGIDAVSVNAATCFSKIVTKNATFTVPEGGWSVCKVIIKYL